jgi:hypothetical protein
MKAQNNLDEAELHRLFDENFARLRLENGHSLGRDVQVSAWEQVYGYWLKLRHIAETVTDTEVKLNLPNQKSPKGRRFCIEGVVDIVREEEKVTMYDLKTHELQFVRQNLALYRDQLNVYAHIWRHLHGERLDETAIIATPLPDLLAQAIRAGDKAGIERELARWEPVVPIPFDDKNVAKTIADFGRVVDQIEDHTFQPPPLKRLEETDGQRGTFATRVCRNCDLRFSCSSYRQYAQKHKDRSWTKYGDFYDQEPEEEEQLARYLATAPDPTEDSTSAD